MKIIISWIVFALTRALKKYWKKKKNDSISMAWYNFDYFKFIFFINIFDITHSVKF